MGHQHNVIKGILVMEWDLETWVINNPSLFQWFTLPLQLASSIVSSICTRLQLQTLHILHTFL